MIMKRAIHKRVLLLEDINKQAAVDAAAFIRRENRRYFSDLEAVVRELATGMRDRCLVLLSGPSSSGKTTTALLLRDQLRDFGIDAHTVSLDDFYRGREQAPRLPNGSFDYESPEALNLGQLQTCMRSLIKDGRADLPRVDFTVGRPSKETKELTLAHDSVVIFEGIHALNPVFEQHLPQENIFKVFVNTISPIYEQEGKLMARRDIRLVRRLLRDFRFRNSSVENTLDMWPQVMRGENLYLFPYVDTVDILIDTTHAYEPCVFAGELLPLLHQVAEDNPYIETVRRLIPILERFAPLAAEDVPKETLLREFLGGGLY